MGVVVVGFNPAPEGHNTKQWTLPWMSVHYGQKGWKKCTYVHVWSQIWSPVIFVRRGPLTERGPTCKLKKPERSRRWVTVLSHQLCWSFFFSLLFLSFFLIHSTFKIMIRAQWHDPSRGKDFQFVCLVHVRESKLVICFELREDPEPICILTLLFHERVFDLLSWAQSRIPRLPTRFFWIHRLIISLIITVRLWLRDQSSSRHC